MVWSTYEGTVVTVAAALTGKGFKLIGLEIDFFLKVGPLRLPAELTKSQIHVYAQHAEHVVSSYCYKGLLD